MIRVDLKTAQSFEYEYLALVKDFFKFEEFKTDAKGNKTSQDKLEKVFRGKRILEFKMLRYFHQNLEKIILVGPENTKSLQSEFLNSFLYDENNKVHVAQLKKFKERMVRYYDSFFQKKIIIGSEEINYGRLLARKLGINVCPYCNHNFIFTINDSTNNIYSKPQFDHFLPKAKYPIFALSLYNLIPSCYVCNKIKDEKEVSFNPYSKSSEEMFFKIQAGGNENPHKWITGKGQINIKIDHTYDGVHDTPITDKNNIVKALGLDLVYGEHAIYAEEIVDKIYAYNKDYYNSLIESFNGLGKTADQIETIIWSAYLRDVGGRPLSKMTVDILDQLGIKRIDQT